MFSLPNVASVPMGSRAWAKQNGGKRESHRCEGFVCGRGRQSPRKTRTIPKATQLWSGESGSFTPATPFLLTSPWVFHLLGEDRTQRHSTVPAACPALRKEEPRVQSRDTGVTSFYLHQPKSIFCPPRQPSVSFSLLQPRQARKADAIY